LTLNLFQLSAKIYHPLSRPTKGEKKMDFAAFAASAGTFGVLSWYKRSLSGQYSSEFVASEFLEDAADSFGHDGDDDEECDKNDGGEGDVEESKLSSIPLLNLFAVSNPRFKPTTNDQIDSLMRRWYTAFSELVGMIAPPDEKDIGKQQSVTVSRAADEGACLKVLSFYRLYFANSFRLKHL